MSAMFEQLESRQMLSVTHSGFQVNVYGTAGNDSISLWQDPAGFVFINDNGLTHVYHPALVSQIAVWGYDGNDTISANDSLSRPLNVYAGNGDDQIHGGAANDYLFGEFGNDVIVGRLGNDWISGGADTDRADYSTSYASLNLTLDGLWNDIGAGTDNLLTDIENITGGYGSDFIQGSAANNNLQGGGGTDWIYGYGGNDVLDGGVGGVAIYSQNTGNDWLFGGVGNDILHASDYGNNYMYGEDGNDWMYAYSGADYLNGGWGEDALYGGANNDQLYGSYGSDWIYGQDGNDAVYAGAGNDFAFGDNGNDKVYGEDGDDEIGGGFGNDELFGGAGADRMYGNEGDDILVSIDNATTDNLWGGAGNDSFWGDEDLVWWWTNSDAINDASAWENANSVRRVRSFANGADRTLTGDAIADPTDSGVTANYSNRALFGSAGPHKNDVDQNATADCWFLSVLGATAKTNPSRIRNMVVSLGDGTYGVMFMNGGTQTFYRVDADLPTVGGNLVQAGFGHDQSIWVPILEKAYTHHRTGANTYSSIGWGWMSEAFEDIGATSITSRWTATSGLDLLNHISSELSLGKAVTFAVNTPSAGAPLVGSHAYMVDTVNYGWVFTGGMWQWQAVSVTLRNPWAVDGAGSDGADDAYVTVTAAQALASFSGVQSAFV